MSWNLLRAMAATGLTAIFAATPVLSAEQSKPRPNTPLRGAWTTEVSPGTPGSPLAPGDPSLSDEQNSLVERVSAYFNTIEHLQGTFVQISPDNETTAGKFYVRRPGRLRFDYASPSKLRIVADGRYLSIEDHDLKTVDQYPLDSTPFGLLLNEDVNLTRDANIIDIFESEDVASVTVEDKSDGSRGRLQLFFTLPEIELKEWVITDPQGLDTRIQLANHLKGKEHAVEFFKSSALDFETFGQN